MESKVQYFPLKQVRGIRWHKTEILQNLKTVTLTCQVFTLLLD